MTTVQINEIVTTKNKIEVPEFSRCGDSYKWFTNGRLMHFNINTGFFKSTRFDELCKSDIPENWDVINGGEFFSALETFKQRYL